MIAIMLPESCLSILVSLSVPLENLLVKENMRQSTFSVKVQRVLSAIRNKPIMVVCHIPSFFHENPRQRVYQHKGSTTKKEIQNSFPRNGIFPLAFANCLCSYLCHSCIPENSIGTKLDIFLYNYGRVDCQGTDNENDKNSVTDISSSQETMSNCKQRDTLPSS